MGECPFDPAAYDPLGPGMLANPYGVLAAARSEMPVFQHPGSGMWTLLRYHDIKQAFSDPGTYSSKHMVRVWPVPEETRPFLPDGHPMEGAPVTTDPPRHTQIRRLVQKAFTPKVVADREDSIRAAAHRLVDGFIDRGAVDIVEAYTSEIPPWVVTQLLGVPEADLARFRHWALEAHHLAFAPPDLSPEGVLALSRELVPFDQYIRALIEDRRQAPKEDLTSYLVHAESDEGDPSLTSKELMGVIVSMVTAGSDTTSTLIGHALYILLSEPGLQARVRADRSLIEGLIEEAMRLYGPARAMRRTATYPVEVAGTTIPEGATVKLDLASANRDPEVFPDPEVVDVTRPNAGRHLGFGFGAHFCVGAGLARLEATVAIEALLDRIPELRLPVGHPGLQDEDYDRNAFIPSLLRLDVEW